MMELIFVRHGETDSNKKKTFLGWTDAELNDEGIRQACKLGEELKRITFDGIYSSSLKRASKTAEIINEKLNMEIVYSDNLKERNFGIWDDLTYDEICKRYPKERSEWEKNWINYSVEKGESAEESYIRNIRFVDDVILAKDSGTYLIVTHLGTIRFILTYLLGMKLEDSWRFTVDNCTITRVQITNGYGVLTHLGACHLTY